MPNRTAELSAESEEPVVVRSRPASSWTYRPALDGLRTVAVYLVVLFHAGLAELNNGFVGVDFFFVLSGYLVVNVILSSSSTPAFIKSQTSSASRSIPPIQTILTWITDFWARRVRRLIPAASVTVLVTAALWSVMVPPIERNDQLKAAVSALTYSANWHFIAEESDYFLQDALPSPFLHFWSLAVEGQFYLALPVLILGLALLGRALKLAWIVPVGFVVFAALSLITQVSMAHGDSSQAYYSTYARVYQMLAGVIAAYAVRWFLGRKQSEQEDTSPLAFRAAIPTVTTGLGVLGLIMLGSNVFEMTPSARGLYATGLAVFIIVSVELFPDNGTAKLFGTSVMTKLGTWSYGTYLWHWPLLVLLWRFVDIGPIHAAIFASVLATMLAAVSVAIVEKPIRSHPLLTPRPVLSVAIAVIWTAIMAMVIVPQMLNSEAPRQIRPVQQESGIIVDGNPRINLVPPYSEWEEQRVNEREPFTCLDEDSDECILIDNGPDAFHVHLLGDSHARTMIPAFTKLAEEEGFTFSATALASCPWQDGLLYARSGDLATICLENRPDWYERVLPELQPDLIVVMNRPTDDPLNGFSFGTPNEEWAHMSGDELHQASTVSAAERLTDIADSVVVLEPIPASNFDPINCLVDVTYTEDCAFMTVQLPTLREQHTRDVASENDSFSALISTLWCVHGVRSVTQ